ncbi:MAG TPA: cobalt ECF transporter T component CbiQ [Syntrophobacteraceae bacterium]|nr:cobalt ECF transporter T component CbiQ [Syntrophobacteraceae bacterium]
MATIESSFLDITYLDTLSYQDTPVHRLDPRVKVLATLLYIVCILSFNKYELSALIPFVIYLVVLVALGNLPMAYLLKKVMLAAPFAFFIGIFNPLLDRAVLMHLGPIEISGGWVSFASIMIRFVLTVSAALILIASTGFNAVCMALGKMGAPSSFAVQLLFLYRYIFVLTDEALRMVRARSLRSFGGKGLGLRVFSYMIGQLLLRTLDRAQRIHLAMRCRGFDGEIRMVRPLKICGRDVAFLLGCSALFFLMRLYDIPQWMGHTVTELMR